MYCSLDHCYRRCYVWEAVKLHEHIWCWCSTYGGVMVFSLFPKTEKGGLKLGYSKIWIIVKWFCYEAST